MNKKQAEAKEQEETKKVQSLIQVKAVPLSPVQLKKDMKTWSEVRKVITDFISEHLKEDIDYGSIKIKGKDGTEYESKPTLLKPGSEKFCSLFKLRPTFNKDERTWSMAGSKTGLFCYLCELVNSHGEIVGEGRGAADIAEKTNWVANNAIKIAQKRAQIDAILRTGILSDFFTQDVEDTSNASADEPATEKQKDYFRSLVLKKYPSVEGWEEYAGVKVEELNKKQISGLINKVRNNLKGLQTVSQPEDEVNLDEIPESEKWLYQ